MDETVDFGCGPYVGGCSGIYVCFEGVKRIDRWRSRNANAAVEGKRSMISGTHSYQDVTTRLKSTQSRWLKAHGRLDQIGTGPKQIELTERGGPAEPTRRSIRDADLIWLDG